MLMRLNEIMNGLTVRPSEASFRVSGMQKKIAIARHFQTFRAAAGLYQTTRQALESYNRALEINPSAESLIHNKGMLLEEIEEWKGSSGYVTPRLEE